MGCNASSVKTVPAEQVQSASVSKNNDQNEPLLTSEKPIVAKLDHGITLTYAYMSQKGYYPEGYILFAVDVSMCGRLIVICFVALTKPNQDTFVVRTSFGGDENRHLFGVMDGHGGTGHNCSQFARDRVTEKLEKMLKTIPATDAFTLSFREANDEVWDSVPKRRY